MDPYIAEAKALAKEEDGVHALIVGNRVYDPILFADKHVKFTAQQYIFLRTYRLGVPLEDAAAKANLTALEAEKFLEKAKTREWLADRAAKDSIKQEWEEPGKLAAEMDEVWSGKKEPSKAQIEVLKLFAERVWPVKRQSEHVSQPKIEINIDPSAVQEAFRRQQVIEAEIVKEQKSA